MEKENQNMDYFDRLMNDELVTFTQELVRIKSYSGQEKDIITFIAARMESLGFDEVTLDAMGNVVGRIGHGNQVIMFDSHVDTVEVKDEQEWSVPPFSGDIIDGRLYGRGSVDMKSSAAASIYGAILAKKQGWTEGKTVYVSCTVLEEDCDGENLKHLFSELKIKPDWMVICEPSDNIITLGHKEFMQGKVTLIGCPKLDDNQYYIEKLAEIFRLNAPKSITVVRMQVPCCGGITAGVRQAMLDAKTIVPYREVTLSADGQIVQ